MARKRYKRRSYNKSYNKSKLSFPDIEIEEKVKKDAVGIFLFALAVISILSFMGLAGGLGESVKDVIRALFGFGSFLFPLAMIVLGTKIIKSENIIEGKTSVFGMVIMMITLVVFFHISYNPHDMFEVAKAGDGGGFLGAAIAWLLVGMVGKWGAIIIIATFFIISLLITFNISFLDLVGKIRNKKKESLNVDGEDEDSNEEIEDMKVNIAGKNNEGGILSSVFGKTDEEKKSPEFSINPIGKENDDGEQQMDEDMKEDDIDDSNLMNMPKKLKHKNWKTPNTDILDGRDGEPTSGDIRANMNMIKRSLFNFGIPVEMGEVNVGPTVTQYTFKPATGIKLSRITSLHNDLALALSAHSLRIEAPIPGKPLVGIEVPNRSVAMVRLKNMLNSVEFKNRKSDLSVVLGRDVAGNPVLADLAKMPHLLIAGSTGSGKTVCINTLITGLLFQNSPDNLKFIMVDPKRVELASYSDIPHLLTPVITDPDKAINSLKWSISEMENRYELLSQIGSRNIESYNVAVSTKYRQRETLPYIIIIVDELADLMATHGREVEAAAVRLAQMARAVGIHLVLSTQRPSVEVITGLIKANITTRIAFQVASQIDSRTIIDMSGAEKLLGNGDMLYVSGDSNRPKRIQGVFISEEEVKKVADFLKSQNHKENDYNEEITENKKTSLEFSGEDGVMEDDLYYDAVEVVKEAGKASASLLQRRIRVGYARAARLLDIMEDKGIIGPADGAKPREVYLESMDGGESGEDEESAKVETENNEQSL